MHSCIYLLKPVHVYANLGMWKPLVMYEEGKKIENPNDNTFSARFSLLINRH
jgi:hypothetical protein